MKLWVQVLLPCSQFAWCLIGFIIMGLYTWVNKGYSVLATGVSPLGRFSVTGLCTVIIQRVRRSWISIATLFGLCTFWTIGRNGTMGRNGNHLWFPTLLHHLGVECYCQWLGKWDKIQYIQAFRSLHNRILVESVLQEITRSACRPKDLQLPDIELKHGPSHC